jgi:hypothetical protein
MFVTMSASDTDPPDIEFVRNIYPGDWSLVAVRPLLSPEGLVKRFEEVWVESGDNDGLLPLGRYSAQLIIKMPQLWQPHDDGPFYQLVGFEVHDWACRHWRYDELWHRIDLLPIVAKSLDGSKWVDYVDPAAHDRGQQCGDSGEPTHGRRLQHPPCNNNHTLCLWSRGDGDKSTKRNEHEKDHGRD